MSVKGESGFAVFRVAVRPDIDAVDGFPSRCCVYAFDSVS
jgi:hypothetical protein